MELVTWRHIRNTEILDNEVKTRRIFTIVSSLSVKLYWKTGSHLVITARRKRNCDID